MKKVFYVILSILVLYLILCLVGASDSKVERSIAINSPVNIIQAGITDHKIFHEKWSPWTEKDPGMKVTYEGTAGQPGHKMSWESNVKDVGKGSMVLNGINGDSVIETLSFDGMGDSKIYFITKPENNATNVTWGMTGKTPFLFRGMMMFMNMDKMVGPDFEKGLGKLKTEMESKPVVAEVAAPEIKEAETTEKIFIGTERKNLTIDKIGVFLGESYGKIGAELKKNNLEMTGAPSALYWNYNQETGTVDCAAAIPVAKNVKIKGFVTYDIPPSQSVQTVHHGDYMKLPVTTKLVKDYMKEKNLNHIVEIEEYITDAGLEKDTSKWMTNMTFIGNPIKK